jgi:hypothetical protein
MGRITKRTRTYEEVNGKRTLIGECIEGEILKEDLWRVD